MVDDFTGMTFFLFFHNIFAALHSFSFVEFSFEGFQTAPSEKYHVYVVILISNQPLEIPDSLTEQVVNAEAPFIDKNMKFQPVDRDIKTRRTKTEINATGRMSRVYFTFILL